MNTQLKPSPSLQKLQLRKETLTVLQDPQMAEIQGGARWTDGWCDITWSGGMVCYAISKKLCW